MSANRPVSPGDPLVIQASEWNDLRELRALLRESSDTPFERPRPIGYPHNRVFVRNDSGSDLDQFSIVGLGDPLILSDEGDEEFKSQPTFKVVKPVAGTHENKFGILLQPLGTDDVGEAVVVGVCHVRLTGTNVGYAEIANASTVLTAGAGGSARVLWAEAGSSERWAIVRLGASTAKKAAFATFTLPSALATTDASKAGCTVNSFWGGISPGSSITVYNLPASSNYIFSGASGNKGLATYDDVNDKYWIVQLQCP